MDDELKKCQKCGVMTKDMKRHNAYAAIYGGHSEGAKPPRPEPI